jgi:hypothetical protein
MTQHSRTPVDLDRIGNSTLAKSMTKIKRIFRFLGSSWISYRSGYFPDTTWSFLTQMEPAATNIMLAFGPPYASPASTSSWIVSQSSPSTIHLQAWEARWLLQEGRSQRLAVIVPTRPILYSIDLRDLLAHLRILRGDRLSSQPSANDLVLESNGDDLARGLVRIDCGRTFPPMSRPGLPLPVL